MPVSALQEFLQKRGEPIPVYTETISGPPFTVTVRCGDVTVEHVGASKKDAKHKAAEAMLLKLTESSGIPMSRSSGNHDSNLTTSSLTTSLTTSSIASNLSHASASSLSDIDPATISNPIGFLQEQMQKHGYNMPEYAHRDSLHPLHPFTHIVTLPSFKITAEGYGSKKNEAKRQAAKAMIQRLKDNGFPYGVGNSSLGTSIS